MTPIRKHAVLAATLLLPGTAFAQASAPAQTTPAPPAPTNSVQQPAQTPIPQPSAKTPPTPVRDKTPDTAITGVKSQDIKDTNIFLDNGAVPPGQPLPSDPSTIRTLDDALAIAFQRNPSILLSLERAVRTNKGVDQILALKKPQISVGGTYNRLLNANAQGGQIGGPTPSSIQNPFTVGLQNTPPGSVPISLSSSGQGSAVTSTSNAAGATSTATNLGTTGTGGGTPTGAAQTPGVSSGAGGQTRSVPSQQQRLQTRQTRQTDPTDPPPDPTDPPPDDGNSGNVRNFVNSPNLNQISTRISVTQLLDITGLVKTAEQVGNLGKALSRLELARTRQDTALNIKNGYYNVLRALAFVRVNEAAVAQSQELLRVTQAQLNAGVASQFDVLRARTQLDNNRQALISSRNQVSISKNAFANSLGIDPSTPIDPQPLETPPVPDLNEAALIQTAFDQRPEYLQADVNIILAKRNIRLARRTLEPYLNAGITGNYAATSNSFGQDRGTASVGLALTVPLYDGGATRAQVESARSDERGALIQKDQYARGIKAEVQQSVIAVRDADERRTAIAQTVEQAREALRLANVRFQAGVGTQLDVNDAQTALTQSEYNQVNAQYDFLGAVARLQRSVGTPQ
ncbi:MAG: TolC family protein [Cytophagales bacterium]|nr:TolC family protein [Armatimonadota bacterium]